MSSKERELLRQMYFNCLDEYDTRDAEHLFYACPCGQEAKDDGLLIEHSPDCDLREVAALLATPETDTRPEAKWHAVWNRWCYCPDGLHDAVYALLPSEIVSRLAAAEQLAAALEHLIVFPGHTLGCRCGNGGCMLRESALAAWEQAQR